LIAENTLRQKYNYENIGIIFIRPKNKRINTVKITQKYHQLKLKGYSVYIVTKNGFLKISRI